MTVRTHTQLFVKCRIDKNVAFAIIQLACRHNDVADYDSDDNITEGRDETAGPPTTFDGRTTDAKSVTFRDLHV